MVIGEQKNSVYFVDNHFSFFKNLIVYFKQIVRIKPLGYVFVVYAIFIIFPCLSHSFSESPRQNWRESRSCTFLVAEIQDESLSNIGFFVKSSGAEVKDVSDFNKWLSELSSSFKEYFFGFGRAIEQICSVGSQQNSEDSYKYWGHCFLLGVILYLFVHFIFKLV